MSAGESASGLAAGLVRSFFESEGFFDHGGDRGEFGDKGESAVFVDGNNGWNDVTFLIFGGIVVLLDEFHDGDAMLAQSRADRRSWSSGPGWEVEFEGGFDFFGHGGLYLFNLEKV